MFSSSYQIFLAQFERDENIQTLVKSMREMFDLSQAEDIFKIIKPNSNQALILKVMLKHITICNDVIQRYAKDKEFGMSLHFSCSIIFSEGVSQLDVCSGISLAK